MNSDALFFINTKVPATAYQWQIFNGTDFENLMDTDQYSGTDSPELIISDISLANQNQLYRCVLSFGDCTSASEVANLFVSEPMSTNTSLIDYGVSFSPNPATINLQVSSDFDENRNFEVFDLNGILVLSGILDKKTVNIDISKIPVGLYIFSIEGLNSPAKFIKSN